MIIENSISNSNRCYEENKVRLCGGSHSKLSRSLNDRNELSREMGKRGPFQAKGTVEPNSNGRTNLTYPGNQIILLLDL